MTGPGRDSGVATVWAATAVAVLTFVLVAGLHVGAAIGARHRADSAADLAALAAAARAVEGEQVACTAADTVARAAGAEPSTCRLEGWDALVEARVAPALTLPGAGPAVGRARAGPDSAVVQGVSGGPRAPPPPVDTNRPPRAAARR